MLRNLRMYVENCDDRFFFVADKSNVVRSTMYREIIYIINKNEEENIPHCQNDYKNQISKS